ncbi:uncharacterized protein J3R85_003130 [Psidium guajava]|nr:uncharacterized protein J3R85_003130 [Psidium guajava]
MALMKIYGKISEAEQTTLDARRRARKRSVVIIPSSVAIMVAAMVSPSTHANSKDGEPRSLSTPMKAVCGVMLGLSFFVYIASHAWMKYHLRPGFLGSLVLRYSSSSYMLEEEWTRGRCQAINC